MRLAPLLNIVSTLILAGITMLSPALSPAAHAAVPRGGELAFTVMRTGEQIGQHILSFEKTADALIVGIQTKIAVKVFFVTAYAFDHQAREVWRQGRLVALTSTTNDDGTDHSLAVTAADGALAVIGDGKRSRAAAAIIPASLWNEGILKGGIVLNTLDGKQMKIAVADAGVEMVKAKGQTVPARHYIIAGDLQRELWFDDNQVLVKVRFKGSDGSTIEYVLR